MASTIIQPVADRLKTLLEGLALPTSLKVPASGWQRDHLAKLPAAEIELPDIGRTDIEEAESQLGSNDWDLDFVVSLWFDLREPTVAQQRLAEAIEKWVAAVDGESWASVPGVLEAKVLRAERVYQLEKQRTLVGYETTVRVFRLVVY